jgi:hypothetical protein
MRLFHRFIDIQCRAEIVSGDDQTFQRGRFP